MDADAPEGIVQKDRWLLTEHSLIWVLPPALRGLRRGLKQADFPGLPHALSSGGLRQRAVHYRRQGLPLWRVLWSLLWRDFIGAIFFGCGQGFFSVVARPLLLKAIIGVVEEGERDPKIVSLLLLLLVSSLALEGLCIAGSKHTLGERFCSGSFTVVVALLHDKCWRIRDSASGLDVVNLLGTDCTRCLEYGKSISLFPAALTMVIAGVVVIFSTMDPVSATTGLASVCAVLFLNMNIARMTQRAEAQNLAKADERLAIVQQLINGIRAVKLSAWEESYLEKIKQAREEECVPMRRYRVLQQSQIQIGRANPILAACVTFCIFGLRGGSLDPGNIFAALNVFLGMRMALIILPENLSYIMGIYVVLQRVEEYLNLPEVETTASAGAGQGPSEAAPALQGALALQDLPCKEPLARISNFTGSWSDDGDFQLQVPHFAAWPGQLVAVVGPVASGKSSLLLALLGEMGSASSATLQLRGTVGYAGQRPFVLADTVRENIVMGREYDEELLGEALWRAALDEDVDALPVHVDTFIGERGVSLSGGQQQRLALARALYGSPSLLLCDDPLSALDAPTAQAVFERGLQPHPHPSGRAAVVVLNQEHLLPEFDVAFEMKDGWVRPRDPKAEPSPRSVDRTWSVKEKSTNTPRTADGDDRCVTVVSTKTFRSYASVPVEKKQSRSMTVTKEASATGGVGWAIVRRYIVGFQGRGKDGPCRYLFFSTAVGSAVITYVLMATSDRWLAYWVSVMVAEPETPAVPYVGVYFGLCLSFVFMLLLSSALFSIGGVRSGREMHNDCIQRLLRAPLSFFEATPSGRITSRLSSDLGVVDMVLAKWADNTMQIGMTLLIVVVQILSILPVLFVPLMFAFAAYAFMVMTVNIMSREAKRLQNTGMSPVQTAMREASDGKVVLRAMDLGGHMNERLVGRSDALCRFIYFGNTVIAWGMLMSCVTGALLTSVAAFVAMVWDIAGDPSDAALVLTYCFIVPYFLQFLSLCVMSSLQALPSLERLLQYSEGTYVPQEAAWDMPGDNAWKAESKATRGMEIVFEDVNLTYAAGLSPAVCGASFQIQAGERLGVVGRTGAGKSSLLLLLLRVREPTSGRILLGGADAQTLGLMTLRRAVGVIPQTPLLISGSVRKNLDPWEDHSEQQLQSVVQKVGLGSLTPTSEHTGDGKQTDANGSILEAPAIELSAGERQLLSVARCLLRTATVRAVLLDEPTSNIDLESDAVVNSVIQEELATATLITIAHRLHTVVDSDRVLVMDQGTAIELAPPSELLSNPDSHFAGMASSLGPAVLEELLHLAKSAAEAKAGGLALEHVRLEPVLEHPVEEAEATSPVDTRPHSTMAGKSSPFSIGCQNPLRCLFPST